MTRRLRLVVSHTGWMGELETVPSSMLSLSDQELLTDLEKMITTSPRLMDLPPLTTVTIRESSGSIILGLQRGGTSASYLIHQTPQPPSPFPTIPSLSPTSPRPSTKSEPEQKSWWRRRPKSKSD